MDQLLVFHQNQNQTVKLERTLEAGSDHDHIVNFMERILQ